MLLPCATGPGLTGGTLRPSPVNPVLASAPKLPSHILLLLSQEDPFRSHGNRSCLCPIHEPPSGKLRCGGHWSPLPTPPAQEGGHWSLGSEHGLGAGWQRTLSPILGLGFWLSRHAQPPPPHPGLPARPPADTACPSMPKEFNPLSPWGAALPTTEASHMGGPFFTSVNSHTCKLTCVGARARVQP